MDVGDIEKVMKLAQENPMTFVAATGYVGWWFERKQTVKLTRQILKIAAASLHKMKAPAKDDVEGDDK